MFVSLLSTVNTHYCLMFYLMTTIVSHICLFVWLRQKGKSGPCYSILTLIYSCKFSNSKELGKILEKQNFLKLTQEGVKNLNHPISAKGIEFII